MSYLQKGLGIRQLIQNNPEINIDVNNYNINVTANYGKVLDTVEVHEKFLHFKGEELPTHLYFHIPLCSYICHFCNYVKKKHTHGNDELDFWINMLVKESDFYLNNYKWIAKANIESVYFGGGTASLLGVTRLSSLLSYIRSNYNLSPNCEITVEGNPDNFLHDEAEGYKNGRFNRFSMGVQSFQSEVNSFAGREHDKDMSLKAIRNLSASGLPFNIDMMFGLPYQNIEKVEEDISLLTELEVPTITIYRLRNVDRNKMNIGNTAVWNTSRVIERMTSDHLFPSLHTTYQMRDAAVNILLLNNYYPSPCGWWNAPGVYPNGNIPQVSKNKWEQFNSMIAFGPGAYGWLTGISNEVIQTHNETNISLYAKKMTTVNSLPPIASGRLLKDNQAIATALGFAFKANQPISIERFKNQFGIDLLDDTPYSEVINILLEKHFLEINKARTFLKTTLQGEALHEEIISVYIHKQIGEFDLQTCKKASPAY